MISPIAINTEFSGCYAVQSVTADKNEYSAWLEVVPSPRYYGPKEKSPEPFWNGMTRVVGNYYFHYLVALDGTYYRLIPEEAWKNWVEEIRDHESFEIGVKLFGRMVALDQGPYTEEQETQIEKEIEKISSGLWDKYNLVFPHLTFYRAMCDLDRLVEDFLWVSNVVRFDIRSGTFTAFATTH